MDQNNLKFNLRLLACVEHAIEQESKMRQQYVMGTKFGFVAEQLKILLDQLQQDIKADDLPQDVDQFTLAAGEILVYVHLYITKPAVTQAWSNIVNTKAMIDYSINRPIYNSVAAVAAFIASKAKPEHHAYLVVALPEDAILAQDANKDALGQNLLKVRQGALLCERVKSFVCNGKEYTPGPNNTMKEDLINQLSF